MADRYQNRSFPAGGDHDRDTGSRTSANAESDPLAELARLIGQTDPFGSRPISRANLQVQPQARPLDREPSYDNYAEDPEPEEEPPPGPPSWMQRAVRQEAPPPP
ncbi:MAG: SPOR domain-containing protein, partial [Bradyrhizobium sp.]